MLDWLITYLGSLQGGIVRTLAAELRAGGLVAAWLAFGLGAVHALTPGHGKAAIAAYFLGREAHIGKGIRVALVAALLHVLSGFAAFLVLRFFIAQAHSITGRGSPTFTVLGYCLIIVAGAVMLFQSVRSASFGHDGAHLLTGGIGLLPCPLRLCPRLRLDQGTVVMVAVVLVALALGIATTIGIVAVATILVRNTLGQALAQRVPQLERGARVLQVLPVSLSSPSAC